MEQPSIQHAPYCDDSRPLMTSRKSQLQSSINFTSSPSISRWASRGYSSSHSSDPVDEDILIPGDVVGEGIQLQSQTIRLVPGLLPANESAYLKPAQEFEVVRRLGTGSYAVVYLVREVLSRPELASDDGHMSIASMELGGTPSPRVSIEYGREYALKCLSKANLDEEALTAQMSEVTIHQSLRSHPNIVTLHRTLETASFLLLLLEFVPGEDLYYFLEQSRDHYDAPTCEDSPLSSSHTPPTPSLLATLNPAQLLSRTRLRLIASMFAQMCDAVAACHDQQVYHRDIKPENFIVTDGWTTLADGRRERKVIVKLTDFGLSTSDVESSDMDCGSAPYMSYECRNNIAPTYRPRGADVWSLGIVLINMLYHFNPWTDTSHGACSSFEQFCRQPVNFFMNRFPGMTRAVAETLGTRVFCVLEDTTDDSPRIGAREFGAWARDLPTLLGEVQGHKRVPSIGHPISSSVPQSHRPCSRSASVIRTPVLQSRSLSRAPSSAGIAVVSTSGGDLSTVFDQDDLEEEDEDEFDLELEGTNSRSASTNRRRKRGARKGKGLVVPVTPTADETLAGLAVASQSLAREISKVSSTSRSRTTSRKVLKTPYEPVSMYPLPASLLSAQASPVRRGSSIPLSPLPPKAPVPVVAIVAPVPLPVVVKKSSKWKLGFGKSDKAQSPVIEEVAASVSSRGEPMSATASNVTNLLMGLSAPPRSPPTVNLDKDGSWSRGRKPTVKNNVIPVPSALSPERWADTASTTTSSSRRRAISPGASSVAHSTVSSNWRSTASTSSQYTRYSNGSVRSVSTAATSVSSASSWRSKQTASSAASIASSRKSQNSQNGLPTNVKLMTGIPWELDELPRDMYPRFDQQPSRKPPRVRKNNVNVNLDTISERPSGNVRADASTSTTDLDGDGGVNGGKVQKGQINALAKMLSALRR